MQWLVEERNVAASPELRVDAVVQGWYSLATNDCLVAENAAALPKQTSLSAVNLVLYCTRNPTA